ncbi:MAG: hypothetical protein JEY94_13635 [Melioribacteraceae bacterium]|nr:hypothetical protein [Melioribacteraceae bacterium]
MKYANLMWSAFIKDLKEFSSQLEEFQKEVMDQRIKENLNLDNTYLLLAEVIKKEYRLQNK